MKLDFLKVEQKLSEALYSMFVKKVVEGKKNIFLHSSTFLGQTTDKPKPQDSVIQALEEFKLEEEEQEMSNNLFEPDAGDEVDTSETWKDTRWAPLPYSTPERPPSDESLPPSPLLILRNRILWLVKKKIANVYGVLGTTREEMVALRNKKELTEAELKRVLDLIAKSDEIKFRIKEQLGVKSDDALVETEKKKHLTKRFNVRDTWLPL